MDPYVDRYRRVQQSVPRTDQVQLQEGASALYNSFNVVNYALPLANKF